MSHYKIHSVTYSSYDIKIVGDLFGGRGGASIECHVDERLLQNKSDNQG